MKCNKIYIFKNNSTLKRFEECYVEVANWKWTGAEHNVSANLGLKVLEMFFEGIFISSRQPKN
jgi:hypothetical protein